MRTLALALSLSLLAALPTSAQQIASAHVTVYVPELMVLDVVSHDPAWQRAPGEGEALSAVQIRVSANRTWKIMVSGAYEAGDAPVWVRLSRNISHVEGAWDYVPVSGARTEIARGGAGGDIQIALDYRWNARATTAAPVYTLVAD